MKTAQVNYAELLGKIDAKVDELRRRHAARFACRRGCHGCCAPGLTVSALEADAIREFLATRPDARAQALRVEAEKPFGDMRCSFLDAEGACTIYEARPVLCRSHGAPVVVPPARRDVCPLNFTDVALEALPAADFINVETVNVILAVLNRQHDSARADERTPLRPSAFV